jgi:ABC-type sugar transport system substrate-binding protein
MIHLLRSSLISMLCVLSFSAFPVDAAAGNQKTVALVMKSLSNPFFLKMEEGARRYADEQHIPLEVFGIDRETDVDRQTGIIESLISRKYGAIVVAPADSKKIIPICKKALDNGIFVINIDNPFHKPTMEQAGISIPFIGSDNYAGARMVGTYVKRKLKKKGRVLVVEGIRGVENADLRKKGFIDAVTDKSAIKIVSSQSANWHTDEALSLVAEFFKTNQSADAIFCANDAMALGALQAVEMMNRQGEILIAGYDNIDAMRTEIRNRRAHATIEQHPELMGEYGVEAAWKQINGIKISSRRTTPLDLITREPFGKRVAFSVSTLNNSFFSILMKEAKTAAHLFGIDLLVLDAGNEDAQQMADIMDALSQKVDLLIVNPTNSEAISPAVEAANVAGLPVITVDRTITAGQVLCHIASDNAQGGKMAGRYLSRKLDQNGQIVELEGIPGTSAAYERGAGFNQEIAKFDGIKVIFRESAEFERQAAKEVMLRILGENKPIDGIFAHNDNMILGAIDAYTQKKQTTPKVLVGFDAIPEAIAAIQAGKLTATIAQEPKKMGKYAVVTAAEFFRGEKIESTIRVPLTLVKN